MLVAFPINNNENRIQPFLKHIRDLLRIENLTFLFIEENVVKSAISTLQLERDQNPNDKIEHLRVANNISRGESLFMAYEYARDNNIDYILFVNDGWEDNIFEFANILNNKEYLKKDLITANRTPKISNLGSYFNSVSNFLFSLLKWEKVSDAKGDSLFIVKREVLNIIPKKLYKSDSIFFEILMSAKNVQYSIINNGINYKSHVKLNTAYMLKSLFFFLRYILR